MTQPRSTPDVFVALGTRRYRVDRTWAQLPPEMRHDGVSQVAVDSQDRVYVFQRGDPPVVVFDAAGAFVGGWGNGLIADAHGIFITAHDEVILVDRDGHRIVAFDLVGRELWSIGDSKRPQLQAPFNHPADVAVDSRNGHVYVADGYANSVVHCFDAEHRLIRSWGRPGAGPGEFTTPHGIWIDGSGRVLVSDRENDRVQLFDAEGRFLSEWRDLYHPMDIYIEPSGYVFVTDQIPRLTMYSPDGELVGRCKPVPIGGHGVWGDSLGNLYLAEVAPIDRVTKLVRLE
jgi:DNA-binding beta-propeller fold protein YncE